MLVAFKFESLSPNAFCERSRGIVPGDGIECDRVKSPSVPPKQFWGEAKPRWYVLTAFAIVDGKLSIRQEYTRPSASTKNLLMKSSSATTCEDRLPAVPS